MTFIDAALSLLQKSKKAMTAEQLAAKAGKAQLLDSPGKDPLRGMKSALARELKKGQESRVVAVDSDHFQLAAGAVDAGASAAAGKQPAKAKAKTKAGAGEETAATTKTAKSTTKTATATTKKKTAAKKTQKAADEKTGKTGTQKARAGGEPAAKADESAAPATPAKPERKRSSRKRAAARAEAPAGDRAQPEAVAEAVVVAESAPESPGLVAEPEAGTETAVEAEAELEADLAAGELTETVAGTEPLAADSETATRRRRNRRSRRKRRGNREDMPAAGAAAADAIPEPVLEPEPEPEPMSVDQLGEVLAPKEVPVRAEVPVTPDDADIQAIYGDELSGTQPGAAFAEYEDSLTEDEDRPMSPEMVSARPERFKRERERRRRRDRQRGDNGEARPQAYAPPARPEARAESRPAARAVATPVETRPAATPVADATAEYYRPGNRLAGRALAVLGDAEQQTLRGKQLARLMNSRGLLAGSPETTWPHLESALVHDERSRTARGIRPRVVARGRGAFEAMGQPADRDLAASESALEAALTHTLAATHRALAQRLGAMSLLELERVAHVYLVTQGYDDIIWIKRSPRSSYAVTVAPGGLGEVLIGVRAGSEPLDRGGVGELRVGVQAKKLASGLLLAPGHLSESARQELRRNGPSLALLVGDSFVSALIRAGVGVTHAQIAVPLLDDTFLGGLREND